TRVLVTCHSSFVTASNPQLTHLLLKVLPIHTDFLGGLGDVAAVAPQRLQQEVAFERRHDAVFGFAERQRAGRAESGVLRTRRPLLARRTEEIRRGNLGAGRQEERLLQCRAQLTDVALPLMADAVAQGVAGEWLHLTAETFRGLLQ